MGKLSAGQSELVGLINEQTVVLNDLTTRLLTTARLDTGDITLQSAPVNVSSMLEEILLSLKDRLASMKVVLEMSDENLVMACDRGLMIMLLTQYIDNACKYSILGTAITIRVMATKTEVLFSVHSFGPVIPVADRERIFERYYRSSKSSNNASGTGIGLSVAKRVAQVHRGHVWVTSEEVEGTTFFASIPLSNKKESQG
jgi:two-component system sensor histidine kinase KdpD